MCVGSHLVKSGQPTQKNITLSSAEAELVAAVRTCSEALGLAQLAYDWGMPMTAKIFVYSSAAIGVASRKGSGKLRHVRVGDLWIPGARGGGGGDVEEDPGQPEHCRCLHEVPVTKDDERTLA